MFSLEVLNLDKEPVKNFSIVCQTWDLSSIRVPRPFNFSTSFGPRNLQTFPLSRRIHTRVRQIFRSRSSLGYEIGATRRVKFRSFVALGPREPLPVHSLKTRPVTAIKSAYADGIAISRGLCHPTTANFVSKVALGCQLTPEVFRTKIESLQLSWEKIPRKASIKS